MTTLQCGSRALSLSAPQGCPQTMPAVMGILNITPDSFSDGGNLYHDKKPDLSVIVAKAQDMVNQGATILDVGGESTRPGAVAVSEQEELDRVIPVVESLNREVDAIISVDTSTAAVITEAAKAGMGIINDVRALQREGALKAAAATELPVVLMHMQGTPQDMQDNPHYENAMTDVMDFLQGRVAACENAGIQQICLDPGFGFGKTLPHNLLLLNQLEQLQALGKPLLVGLSRKSMLGLITEQPVEARQSASVAGALLAAQKGAAILRVHDVAATVDALKVWQAVESV